jgi:hypothetical protein
MFLAHLLATLSNSSVVTGMKMKLIQKWGLDTSSVNIPPISAPIGTMLERVGQTCKKQNYDA